MKRILPVVVVVGSFALAGASSAGVTSCIRTDGSAEQFVFGDDWLVHEVGTGDEKISVKYRCDIPDAEGVCVRAEQNNTYIAKREDSSTILVSAFMKNRPWAHISAVSVFCN